MSCTLGGDLQVSTVVAGLAVCGPVVGIVSGLTNNIEHTGHPWCVLWKLGAAEGDCAGMFVHPGWQGIMVSGMNRCACELCCKTSS